MSDYYADVTEQLPIATCVELYQQHLPRFMARWLAGWLRFRTRLGFPPLPLYGARSNPDFVWQARKDMPAQALSRWAPYIERLEDLGFEVCGWVTSDAIGQKEEAYSFLLNESGITMASVLWQRMVTIEQTLLSFTSYRADGTELMTAALPENLQLLADAMVPEYVALTCESSTTPADTLYRIHSDRPELADAISFTNESLLTHYRKQRVKLFEYFVEKGLLRPLSKREIARLKARLPAS